jgi:hypothetical protein
VADNKHPEPEASSKHEESLLILRMIRIGVFDCSLIIEDCLGFIEGNAMFPLVRKILWFVPLESDHNYNIISPEGLGKAIRTDSPTDTTTLERTLR